jgi:hypothetical protein
MIEIHLEEEQEREQERKEKLAQGIQDKDSA